MITITIPTTGRPERLKACLDSIMINNEYEIKIGCRQFYKDIPEEILQDSGNNYGRRIAISQSSESVISVQNGLALTAPARSHIMPISDDIVFEPYAVFRAWECLNNSFPDSDGIIGFKITNMPEDIFSKYAFMLIGNKFFTDRLRRRIFFPGYKHFFADTELGKYADHLGRFVQCEKAGLIHYHPSTGAPKDETYMNGRREKLLHDEALFLKRSKTHDLFKEDLCQMSA